MSRERINELLATFYSSNIVAIHGAGRWLPGQGGYRNVPVGIEKTGATSLAACCGSLVHDFTSKLDFDGDDYHYIKSAKILAFGPQAQAVEDYIETADDSVKYPLFSPEVGDPVGPTKVVVEDKNPLTIFYWNR